MIIVTQKIELKEVIKFLVTIIRTINENVIAMAIPVKALETKALSVAMDVHALQVYLMPCIEGASFKALLFIMSM